MNRSIVVRLMTALMAASAFARTAAAAEPPNPIAALAWQPGPRTAVLGNKAEIRVPDGYAFLSTVETTKFMDLNENPSNGDEYLLAPTDFAWFTLFRFDPVGYVKDDEKIDADALLKSIGDAQVAGNQERVNRGWGTLSIKGWRFEPRYDRDARRLEWAVAAKDDATGQDLVNYNTRLLGRTGIMEVTLLAAPQSLDTSVLALKDVLRGFTFSSGEKYAEYRSGDHIAEFGLAALVAGGAAAVAAKKGFFTVALAFLAGAWKFVLAAGVGATAWLRSLFRKRTK